MKKFNTIKYIVFITFFICAFISSSINTLELIDIITLVLGGASIALIYIDDKRKKDE